MDFGSRRQPRRHAAALAIALFATAYAQANAAPFDNPHVGGLTFTGPTTGTLGAVYWNPAALGLIRGNQVMVAGRATLTRVTFNPSSGTPDPGGATASNLTQPLQWPFGPGGFAGISTDLGGDRAALAFAVYEPSLESSEYPTRPGGDEPTRYHRLAADFRNLALVPALAVRLSGSFRIGFAPGLMFSTGRFVFAEPMTTAAGTQEIPASDGHYDIGSGQGIGDAKFSVTLGGGIFFRHRNLSVGLSYTSRPFGGDVPGIEVAGARTTVTGPGGAPINCRAPDLNNTPGSQSSRCVFGDINYRLPDIFIGGVTWHLHPGWELTGVIRFLRMGVMDHIDIRMSGSGLQAMGLPQHLVFHQGFENVWDTRVRVSYWLKERLHVGAGLRVETSAVPAADVNPNAVDGLKFEPMILAEVNLGAHISLTAGYALTLMAEVNADPSRFQPAAAAQCAAGTGGKPAGDLSNPGCVARAQGLARPSPAGTYRRLVQDFGLSMTARF